MTYATPDEIVLPRHYKVVYDGTNAAEILSYLDGGAIVGTPTFESASFVTPVYGAFEIMRGQILWLYLGDCQGVLNPSDWDPRWEGQVRLVEADGVGEVDESVLGGLQTVDVEISPAMSGTSYKPQVTLRGDHTIVSGHSIKSWSVLDANTVRVVVSSAPASLAGAEIYVYAHEMVR